MPSDRVPSLEILLVVDNEVVAQTLSAIIRRAGHRVTAATTLAGTIETLMRRGPHVDVVLMGTRFDSSLSDDIIQYSRAHAPNAQLIVLGESGRRAEAIELVLTRPSAPDDRRAIADWD